MKFLEYLEKRNSYETDIKNTLNKIPKSHYDLVKDYKIVFQISNTLKNDDKHIGLIDEKNKKITISAPWNYGREYTLLHEVAHAVWKYIVSNKEKKEWSKILKETKKKNKELNQNEEEIFCMIYAQNYAKNKLKKFDEKELVNFVKNIGKHED